MIIQQHYATRSDGVNLIITFSDQGLQVVRNGIAYDDAIDPEETHRTYEEGRILVHDPQHAVNYWVRKVQSGEWTIDDVPEWLREKVEEALEPHPDKE